MSTNKKTNTYMRISDIAGFVADYSPDQLKFQNYELPNFIVGEDGKEMVEAEELLAWIIDYSRKEKKWLAIEQREVNDSVQKAYHEYQEKSKLLAANKRRVWIFRRIKFMYYLKLILSLGLYGRNNPVPEIKLHANIPMMDVEEVKLFNKTLNEFLESFKESYAYLRNNGYLHAKSQDYILYLYPSEKVINDMKKFIMPESFYKK
jgi:hypothetical protein